LARIDKYDFNAGGFRAPLAADQVKTNGNVGGATGPLGVGLNASGQVVLGQGNTGIVGVLVLTEDKKAGDIVDVMTAGEITDITGTAGTTYTANTTTGVVSTAAASATQIRVGHTVEAGRLIVRARVA
jgi:hypothetical protein